MRRIGKKKIGILLILIVAILAIGYKMILAPTLYNKYMEEGNSYLTQKQYEQAIESFDKAIKVNSKDTYSRIQKSKAYIGKNEFQNSVDVLEEAQNLDLKNEKLLLEIIDIAVTIDGGTAYDFLDRFVQEVGEANLSTNIRNILNSANESPKPAKMDISEGKDASTIYVKLTKDRMHVGHSYYYTINGDTPDQNSQKYMGNICISNTTALKIIGYNRNGQSTEVVTFKYIDKDELKSYIKKAENLYNNSTEGSKTGQYKSGSKSSLKKYIDEANKVYSEKLSTQEDIDEQVSKLKNAIDVFKQNKVKQTSSVEQKILGKYILIDNEYGIYICKFTKYELKSGYMASEGDTSTILGRRESGNTVYYKTTEGEVPIELLDHNTINLNGTVCNLLNAQQLIAKVYNKWPDMANYDYLSYFGVSQSDIDYFYSH